MRSAVGSLDDMAPRLGSWRPSALQPDGESRIPWKPVAMSRVAGGDALLDRAIQLTVEGLASGEVRIRHRRVDASHSNISAHWEGGGDWPDESVWERLRAADRLDELEPERSVSVGPDGRLSLEFNLPMPSVSLVELLRGG